MAFEMKPDTGSAFKNDKRTTDKHPNYTGNALVGGTSYFVDAWINVRENGDRYISFKFKAKEKQPDAPRPSRAPDYRELPADYTKDLEIPF